MPARMAGCLIQVLQWPVAIPHPPRHLDEITTMQHKAHEATSSSLSAIYLGHYMAGTFNPTIMVFNTQLANLGFTTRYSLKQWQNGLNVM